MIRSVLIAVLVVGLVGVGYWGYTEHRDKNAILIHAENNYQQSFHELNYYVDNLQNKLGSTLAVNSKAAVRPQLADVWRLAQMAHDQVGQLPLSLMPFNDTQKFLANIGEFSYRTGIKEQNQNQLTPKEYATLQSLYKQSTKIKNELRNVQTIAMKNNLRWMDVELALSTQKNPKDNSIIDGLKMVNKTVDGFSNDWGPDMTKMNQIKETRYNNITGPILNKNKAIQKAKNFINLNNQKETSIQELGKGANFPAYSISFSKGNQSTTDITVTKKGGYIASFLINRPMNSRNLSLHKASQKAESFLHKHGYKSMALIQSSQYDTVGVFSFVKTADNVRIYPTKVTLKVALDNGDIIGYNSVDYLLNHKMIDKINLKPKLSHNNIVEGLNPNLKVQETHLAVIKNDLGENVLCYEVFGTIKNATYQLFINATSGVEEQVHLLNDHSSGYNA